MFDTRSVRMFAVACALAAPASAQNAPADLSQVRHINMRAHANPEEMIGMPQNPRRLTVGISLQVLP